MKQRGMWKLAPVLLASLALLSACGKAKFQKVELAASAVAGQYTKPKIDIVVFQDNSDSMAQPMSILRPQLNSFLAGIDGRWDYRFVVLPLLYQKPLSQKAVVASDCSGLNNCSTSANSSPYPNDVTTDWGWINSVLPNGSSDYGLQYMKANLTQSSMVGTNGFIRSDAALAMVVISNGNDISTVRYTTNPGGQVVIDGPATEAALNGYINDFKYFKSTSQMSKFYSVVAPGSANSLVQCYGYQVFAGSNYIAMSNALLTPYFNLCTGGLGGVMTDIARNLQAFVDSYIFNYVVVSTTTEPDPNTITVRKNGVAIPKSNTNGWSYMGYMVDQHTSYFPGPTNKKTGYMIRLNGTAEYKGSDKIDVTYKAK